MFGRLLHKGTGHPLVFLHGFLGCLKDWDKVISCLKDRTCFAFDLPGHGKTPWISGSNIIDLMANAFPPGTLDLVGYSLGGRLALRFAMAYPSRVNSLTLLSTHYGLSCEEARMNRLQEDRVWAQKLLKFPIDEFLRSWYAQPVFSSIREKPELQEEILKVRRFQKSKGLAKALITWSLGREPSYQEALKELTLPLRIIYGECDTKFAELYQSWSSAASIPGVGHILHLESPESVARFL